MDGLDRPTGRPVDEPSLRRIRPRTPHRRSPFGTRLDEQMGLEELATEKGRQRSCQPQTTATTAHSPTHSRRWSSPPESRASSTSVGERTKFPGHWPASTGRLHPGPLPRPLGNAGSTGDMGTKQDPIRHPCPGWGRRLRKDPTRCGALPEPDSSQHSGARY